MTDMITCYIPDHSGNQYSENIKRCLQKAGCRTVPLKSLLRSPGLFFRCRIFNFNWYENLDEEKNIWIQIGMKYILIWFLKLCRKKIVYTVHNRIPHNARHPEYGKAVMKMMLKRSDAVVGLCSETVKTVSGIYGEAAGRLHIIPHPNYISSYRPADGTEIQKLRKQYGFDETDFVCLMIGFVSPYKNIELLTEAVNRQKSAEIKLMIAGAPSSDAYAKELRSKIRSKKVSMDLRYIPDDEISGFYGLADIAVLPYKTESVLNSGAVYLSFSLKRTVICPDIPTVRDITDKSFLYTYRYATDREHLERLEKVISDAYEDFVMDKEAFREKGKKAYEYAARYHSMDRTAKLYRKLYRDLLS